MEILRQINLSIDAVDDRFKLRIAAWNGIIFNVMLHWAAQGFREEPDQLAERLTEITQSIYHTDLAGSFTKGVTV